MPNMFLYTLKKILVLHYNIGNTSPNSINNDQKYQQQQKKKNRMRERKRK